MFRIRECRDHFPDIWRVFISGSSSSGKTYFARKLITSSYLNCNRVYYYHPDIHEEKPVNWEDTNVIFSAGLPTTEELLKIPENSCIILDDLFSEAKDSKTCDYLFRVLSSKRKLHVLIMTQRYFSNGKFTLNIRNSSNIHVLLRNADELSNLRVARSMNLSSEFNITLQESRNSLYPYILINRTNQARASLFQVYIDIFSTYRKVVMSTGIYYLISARDFHSHFDKIDDHTAVKKNNTIDFTNVKPSHQNEVKTKNIEPKKESRRDFARRVRQVVRRYRKRAFIQR